MDSTTLASSSTEKELDEFRNQWKQEVISRQRQQQEEHETHGTLHSTKAAATGYDTIVRQAASLSLNDSTTTNTILTNNNNNKKEIQADKVDTGTTEKQEEEREPETAMGHYIKAVDHERQGQLGKALHFYRQAFRLNRDIDYDYKRHYQTHIVPQLQKEAEQLDSGNNGTVHGSDDDNFRHIVPVGDEYEQPETNVIKSSSLVWQDPLTPLIDEFSQQDTDFIPALDYKPVLISKLPNEILLAILKYLFLHSLSSSARVALVCKRLFLLTRTPSLWRYLCEHAYRPPTMTLAESKSLLLDQVQKYYGGGWYNMFVERPRIRYDGVYISTCHYVRPGTSETSWNQPVHLVTYYRYLRFFTDGRIVKHVTTDEPAQVVKQLDRRFSKRQTFHGRYEWKKKDDDDDSGTESQEQLKQNPTSTAVLRITARDYTLPHEQFFLQLTVKGTHRGRHNKLGWKKYTSINQRSLEDQGLLDGTVDLNDLDDDTLDPFEHVYDLKLMKPYFFSPVRSYHVDYPDEDDDRILIC